MLENSLFDINFYLLPSNIAVVTRSFTVFQIFESSLKHKIFNFIVITLT